MPRFADMPLRLRLALGVLLALLLALPWIAAALGDSYLVRLATRILILGLAAAALDLVLGVGGMVSFGHGAFLGLGGYTAGIMFQHAFQSEPFLGLPPTQSIFVLVPAAMLVAALFALVTGAICLRTRGVAFIMITLAFAQMLFFFFTSLDKYNGDDGIALWNRSHAGGLLDLENATSFYYLCLACLIVFLTLALRLYHARFGRTLQGARENERRMQALGFATYRYRLAAYVLSGAFTGLAGLLLANAGFFVGPSFMSWQSSGHLIVMVVLGGMGTLVGPVLGAAAFLLLEEVSPPVMNLVAPGFGEHWKLLFGPILVAVALFARQGLIGLLGGGRHG
ncbi:MAG TPA: branched-chain amino acid ABC transporter permease [Geminicoccaceae bacterium]|nr:branched-chain amino acid ABC transporter permease [Geminicoccaceae bacterium]